MSQIHSTGRGGAGNIGKDDTVYADGGIVREGPLGESADGADFSTGRGGAGNIPHEHVSGSPGAETHGRRIDDDSIPETAMRPAKENDGNFHTGRGGEGNIHKDKYGGHSTSHEQKHAGESVVDKVKHALHLDKQA